jgi:hypothetical protein
MMYLRYFKQNNLHTSMNSVHLHTEAAKYNNECEKPCPMIVDALRRVRDILYPLQQPETLRVLM